MISARMVKSRFLESVSTNAVRFSQCACGRVGILCVIRLRVRLERVHSHMNPSN